MKTIWAVCLAIYLIAIAMVTLVGLTFAALPIILAILALIAGIALLLGK